MTLGLTNCRILNKGKLVSADVLIEEGKIKKIGTFSAADRVIDCKNSILLPGLIDSHVHMREPGFDYKEGFVTGSNAALKGGVTTFLDMPNTKPPTVTVAALEEKRILAKKCAVNYGFYFGTSVTNIEEIKKAKNIAAVKMYLNETTGNMKIDNVDVLKAVINYSRLTAFHAEGKTVQTVLDVYNKYMHNGNKLYFCHVARKIEIDALKKNDAYVEVAPHHLFLTENDVKRLRGFGSMKPPLAKKSDQAALWNAVQQGVVDTIATDHAPHTIEEKKSSVPPYGVPGIETMLPLLLDAAHTQKLTLTDIQRLCCENPAQIFRMKGKGHIAVGYDADLTLIDPKKKTRISNETIVSKCGWSPWHGKVLKGSVEMTIVNGMIGYKEGQFFKTQGREVMFE